MRKEKAGRSIWQLGLVAAAVMWIAAGAVAQDGQCVGDANGDGEVRINELIIAVNNSLNGCPELPECGDGVIEGDEECELDEDCSGGGICNDSCQCEGGTGELGERVFTIADVDPGDLRSGLFPHLFRGGNAAIRFVSDPLILVAGTPDENGVATLTLKEDAIVGIQQPIGVVCLKLLAAGSTGMIDCDGGSAVDIVITQEAGTDPPPAVVETNVGEDAGPGAATLTVTQQAAQLGSLQQPEDCVDADYDGGGLAYYTTATADGTKGNASISLPGENFSCDGWQEEDGAGMWATPQVTFNIAAGGDTANITRFADN